jgi:hypothetical protein
MKNLQKISKEYNCPNCHYICFKTSEWNKHLSTQKHFRLINANLDEQKNLQFICDCGKNYKHMSSLCKHKKTCVYFDNDAENEIIDNKNITNIVLEVIKQNKELISQNQELTNKLFEVCKNGIVTNNIANTTNHTNSHNKSFNLNFFLNETCKDAMNIMDFVDSLKLQISDLENVGKLGFVEGISSLIVKNLNSLDETKRPVHCTDTKREVMYVKDEDKWEKENDNKQRLRKAIKYIAHKNTKLLPEFRAKYPNCDKSESKLSGQYDKLVIEAFGGKGDNDAEKEDKIIRNIAKEVSIDK